MINIEETDNINSLTRKHYRYPIYKKKIILRSDTNVLKK
jgi:hypothetical protein